MPHPQQTSNKPELKIGPFAGGIAVNVWRNTIQTQQGERVVRSITLSPRRYRDAATGEWKETYSFRPVDLTALILSLEKAQEFITTVPLPQHDQDVDSADQEPTF